MLWIIVGKLDDCVDDVLGRVLEHAAYSELVEIGIMYLGRSVL